MDDTLLSEMQMKSLFTSLQNILLVLKKPEYAKLNEVTELLSIWESSKSSYQDQGIKNNRLIVLEGLDGSGKSTIKKILSKDINAVMKETPPKSISHLREKLSSHGAVLCRAYYLLGNYIVAREILPILETSPVVLDRFWHSTSAYALANLALQKNPSPFPPEGDEIYNWPSDLLKPNFSFYLDVNEQNRINRLRRRSVETEEENRLKRQQEFRDLVVDAYKRFRNPPITVVNSNNPLKTVVKEIKNIMLENPGK